MIFDINDEDKNKTGIYCITNIINNNKYIGQTTEGFYDRYLRHSNLLKNNRHFNAYIQKAYNKHGSDNFVMTIVEVCSDFNKIASLEEKYISEYRQRYSCYNFLSGGPTMCGENNPFYGKKHTKEALDKMSKKANGRQCGPNNYFYGKDLSGEKNGFYGHKHTEEARKKMSIAKSKMYKGENNPFFGKHHTEETKLKLKNNGLNSQHREVKCVETGIVYRSMSEAGKQTNTNPKRISDVCRGIGKTANKLHWQYA